MFLLILFMNLQSCTTVVSTISEPKIVYVYFLKNNQLIKKDDINLVKGSLTFNDNIYKLDFLKIRGGKELFGNHVIREHDVNEVKRLVIKCVLDEIKFKINEILLWPSKLIDEKTVYIAPKICD